MNSNSSTSAPLADTAAPAGFDVVEPWMEPLDSSEEKFQRRKHRLHGNVWVVVDVFRNTVCIHVRELKDGWKNEAGVTLNAREFHWFTREGGPASGTFGRIEVAKQKTGTLIRRTDTRIGGEPSKARRIFITHQGFATLMKEKKVIKQDIKQATMHATARNNQQEQNLELYQNILVVLASKTYEVRSRASCNACSGIADQSNLMAHQCLEEDEDDKLKRAGECLDAVPNAALQSVLVSNNLPHPKLDVSTIISDQRGELVKKVTKFALTAEAQECFDTYFNANVDFIITGTPSWDQHHFTNNHQ